MKQIHANYTFQASTKTITLFGLRIAQNQLLLITNATRGVIYYNFASPTNRAVVTESQNVNNTTIILTDVSTAGHSDSDKLTIYYDDQLSAQTGSLKYLTEVIATANDLGNSQITTLADFNLADDPENLVGAIVVIPYIPFGSLSGLVRLKISGGWSVLSTISAKLADGTTPAFLLKEQFAPLFLPPRTTRIIIEKVNEQGNVSAEGILSTQDIAFKVYRAPEVDYDNPPYSVNIAIETKNAVGNKAESAASSDTGTFSLISLFKRLLSRVTSLVPANLTVTSSRLLVDGSGVTQPVSLANTGANSIPIKVDGSSVTQPVSNATLGSTSDANAGGFAGNFSVISLLKYLANLFVIKLDQRNPFQGVPVLSAYSIVASNTNESAYTVTGRKYYLELKNASSNVMYINFNGAAASASTYRLNANEKIVFDKNFVPNGIVQVFGTSGDKLHILAG